MNLKRTGLILATSALMGFGSMVSFADVSTQYQDTGYAQTDNMAYNLITNYKAKLKAANSFSVNEFINYDLSLSDSKTSNITSGTTVIEGDKVHSIATSTTVEDGVQTENEAYEIYRVRVGEVNRQYTISSKGTEVSDGSYQDPRDSYFPITYHGNETVTFENGEYVVKGWLTADDFKELESANSGISNSVGNGDDLDLIGNMPYECRFNAATGDLTLMTVDMSSLLDNVVSLFAMFVDESQLNSISTSFIYSTNITIDPTLTVVIPAYLG